jgi:hypothetical protein
MFNIILNSQKSNPTFSSGNTNDQTFLFNWTNIPQGKYKMQWTLKSTAPVANLLAAYNPQVELTLGSIPTTYIGGQISQSFIANYIGTLRQWVDPTQQGFYYANLNDNSPTFYTSLPTDFKIQVKMFNDDFLTLFTAGGGMPEYVMFLSFTKI